jgi:hypothetical protein
MHSTPTVPLYVIYPGYSLQSLKFVSYPGYYGPRYTVTEFRNKLVFYQVYHFPQKWKASKERTIVLMHNVKQYSFRLEFLQLYIENVIHFAKKNRKFFNIIRYVVLVKTFMCIPYPIRIDLNFKIS